MSRSLAKASTRNSSTGSDEVFVGYEYPSSTDKKEHAQRKVALAALVKPRKNGASFYVTMQNISEFWNVCTRPIENNGLGLSVEAAARQLKRFERLFVRLTENEQVYLDWRDLVTQQGVIGIKVHDAKLVALMMVHRVDGILTFNTKDFKRYSEIKAINPTEV